MVGSTESTDTATFSSSSPPDSVPDTAPTNPRELYTSKYMFSYVSKALKFHLLNNRANNTPVQYRFECHIPYTDYSHVYLN